VAPLLLSSLTWPREGAVTSMSLRALAGLSLSVSGLHNGPGLYVDLIHRPRRSNHQNGFATKC